MVMLNWVKLPSEWIENNGLVNLTWGYQIGSNNTAALMVLMAIVHHANDDTGVVRLTYDEICEATSLIRV